MSQTKVQLVEGKSDQTITGSTLTTTTLNAANLNSGAFSNRNLIINGAMQVAQRGTQTSLTTGGNYGGCDRWKLEISNLGTWTLGQDSTDAPKDKGFANCLKLDCTTADASPAAGDLLILQHPIEGYLCNQLAYGQSTAKSVTLSFWCKAEINGWSSGTKSFVAELQAGSTTYESGNLITLTTNDTWQKVTCTFPGMTGQAIASSTTDLGLMINLWLDAGTNYTSGTLSTSWSNKSSADRCPGTTLGLGAHTDNNFFMTGVQLEIGDVATDFEHRSYADELIRCKRYCEVILEGTGSGAYMSNTVAYTTNQMYSIFRFSVEKRATPTLVQTTGTNYYTNWNNNSGTTFNGLTGLSWPNTRATAVYQSGSAFTAGHAGLLGSDNTSAKVYLQCEL